MKSHSENPLYNVGASITGNCPLCERSNLSVVANKGRDGDTLNTTICNHCGYLFIMPRMAPEEHHKAYAGGGFSEDARGSKVIEEGHLQTTNRIAIQRYQRLIDILDKPLRYINIIEAGSGTGSFLRVCKAAGAEVQGIEPDPSYAKQSSDLFNVNVASCNLEDFEDHQDYFDVACSFHVIEHVIDPTIFLKSMRELLKPSGVIFVECPGIDNMHTRHLQDFFWAPHLNVFTKKTLSAFMFKAGFRVTKVYALPNGFIGAIARKEHHNIQIQKYFESPRKWKKWITSEINKPYPPPKTKNKRKALLEEATWKFKNEPLDFIPAVYRRASARINQEGLSGYFQQSRHDKIQGSFVHFGLHQATNAGDTMLFESVRRSFDILEGPFQYELRPLREQVSATEIDQAWERQQGLLIGGGGLIIPDSNPNKNSGWQLNCTRELINNVKCPLILFAIGYNTFRGQDMFPDSFEKHIRDTVRKSLFFGMRNSGSIQKLKKHLPEELWDQLTFQPCTTTVLQKLLKNTIKQRSFSGRVYINMAFDRESMRNNSDPHTPCIKIARFAKVAASKGWQIILVTHLPNDKLVIPYLHAQQIEFELIDLSHAKPLDVLQAYSAADLVIGMRGHAQMIPFGLGVPIFSIISHDKMQFFLDDIGKPDWGVEIDDQKLDDRLVELLEHVDEEELKMRRHYINQIQEKFFKITKDNIRRITDTVQNWEWK